MDGFGRTEELQFVVFRNRVALAWGVGFFVIRSLVAQDSDFLADS